VLKFAPVSNGLFEPEILFLGQGNRDGFSSHLATPLIAGASGAWSPILDITVTDPTSPGQLLSQLLVVLLQFFFVEFHPNNLAWLSIGRYIYRPMSKTPYFREWRRRLGPMGRKAVKRLRGNSLQELDERLVALVPADTFKPEHSRDHSRSRIFTFRLTLECFLWQLLNPGTACREVVRRVQTERRLNHQSVPDEGTSAYIQGRLKLKEKRLDALMRLTGETLEKRAPKPAALQGRRIKVVDGSTTQLPDTAENQEAYPQPPGQKKGCGFPIIKFLVQFSLQTGAILRVVMHNRHAHDLRLFRSLWDEFQPGDISLGDRAFGDYLSLAMLPLRRVDVLARLHQGRKPDRRKGLALGFHDHLHIFTRGKTPSKHLPLCEWLQVPEQITVRVIQFTITEKGFRSEQIVLVTTLLDPVLYPAEELKAAYLRRWKIELCLRDLKTTLGMEALRCKSPSMARKELLTYLIAHNLMRSLILQAALRHDTRIEHLSFKGSLDSFRQYAIAASRSPSLTMRAQLWADLLTHIAADKLPLRPGRREPRAIKKRHKTYALLNKPRHLFVDIPHRNNYRTNI
jgi:Transposase DDE domain